ncbi:MAG: hypothetical protein WB992_05175 [Bryobacteraceae bacterium]
MKILKRLVLPATLLGLGAIPLLRTAYTAPPPEHTHIAAAINALVDAKNDLNAAQHDFCGHRTEAVGAVDQAIDQLRKAQECVHNQQH